MKLSVLNLSWQTTLLRYFLMMFVVITAVLSGMPALALLGLPIFLSALLGIAIVDEKKATKNAKFASMNNTMQQAKKVS